MKTVYVVLERWNTDCMEADATVFTTKEEALKWADAEAEKMAEWISNAVIKHRNDEDMEYDCDVCVENAEGDSDEWYEAKILTRVVN